MIDHSALRQKLMNRIRSVKKVDASPSQTCEHDWNRFKQTLPIQNNNFKGFRAYFIVKACTKCHEKHYVSYIIER